MSLAYYKRFPRDFLEGTIGLSFEVKGAYAIVLDLIYMRDGRLPDDARYIAGQLGCSVRKWTAIRAELIEAGKLAVDGGIISNSRADYLTEESRKYQDKQAEIAGKPRKNNAVNQPKPSQSEPEPEEEATEAKASSPRKSQIDPPAGFDEFWQVFPNKVAKPAAVKAYRSALKAIGGPDPPSVLLAGVERARASREWLQGFIPHPATWLNGHRWEDQPAEIIPIAGRRHERSHPDAKLDAKNENLSRSIRAADAIAGLGWEP